MHLAKFSHVSNDSQYEMNVAIHLEIHLLETLGGSHYRPQALFFIDNIINWNEFLTV